MCTKMVKLLAIFFLTFSSTLILAQEFIIFGSIRDAETKSYLANATVKIYDTERALIVSTQTNAKGRFITESISARVLNLQVRLDSFRTQSFTMEIPQDLKQTNLQVDVDLKRSYFPEPKVENKSQMPDAAVQAKADQLVVNKEKGTKKDTSIIDKDPETRDPKPDVIAEAKAMKIPEPHFGIAFKVERYKDKIPEAANDDYWIRDNRFMFLVRGKFMSKEKADIWMNDNMRADYPTAFVIEIKDGKRVN